MQMHERAVVLAAFLDLDARAMVAWYENTPTADIPDQLRHPLEDLVAVERAGLAEMTTNVQHLYLQQLALLTDAALLWLVRAVNAYAGTEPDLAPTQLERLADIWEGTADELPAQDDTVVDPAGEISEAVAETLRGCAGDVRKSLQLEDVT